MDLKRGNYGETSCRDLVAINRRLQGLAENFCKTQEIVLTICVKDRVRSKKIRDGSRLKRPDRFRGLLVKVTRHKRQHKD